MAAIADAPQPEAVAEPDAAVAEVAAAVATADGRRQEAGAAPDAGAVVGAVATVDVSPREVAAVPDAKAEAEVAAAMAEPGAGVEWSAEAGSPHGRRRRWRR